MIPEEHEMLDHAGAREDGLPHGGSDAATDDFHLAQIDSIAYCRRSENDQRERIMMITVGRRRRLQTKSNRWTIKEVRLTNSSWDWCYA